MSDIPRRAPHRPVLIPAQRLQQFPPVRRSRRRIWRNPFEKFDDFPARVPAVIRFVVQHVVQVRAVGKDALRDFPDRVGPALFIRQAAQQLAGTPGFSCPLAQPGFGLPGQPGNHPRVRLKDSV